MILEAFAVLRQILREIAYETLGAPLVVWPRRFWASRFHNTIVRAIVSLVPLGLLIGILYLDRFIARVDAVPTRMPHRILFVDGPQAFKTLHHVRDVSLAAMAQLIYLRDGTMHIIGQASAEFAVLMLGAVAWLEMLLASTFLLAPLHVLMLSRASQERMDAFSQKMRAPVRRGFEQVWSAVAQRRHLWFVGADVVRGEPCFVNVEAQRMSWVLGGADRRSNAQPFFAQVRAAVQGGGPILLIDSVDNAGMAADLETCAIQAGRVRSFQRIRLNEQNAAEFHLDAGVIQREQRIVYLGIPTYQKNLDIQEAAKRAILALADLGRLNEGEDGQVLLVAVQDPRDLPEQPTQALVQSMGLRLLFAQQQCDADDLRNMVACLAHQPRHTVLCLTLNRTAEASNVAHAMAYASSRANKDKMQQSLSTPAMGSQIIQNLKRGEALALVNGFLWDVPIQLASKSTKKRVTANEHEGNSNSAHP